MSDLAWIAILTAAFEALTCVLRFGFKLESTRDTRFLRRLTRGLRIHHGYIGLAMVLLLFVVQLPAPWHAWTWRVGWALLLSDVIHHFLVLWPITGDPEFHVTYPDAEN